MSSLTKFIFTDRHRPQRDHKGDKTPMMMEIDVPGEFDPTCISLLSGKLHMVTVKQGRPTKTGWFKLTLEEEDAYMAKVVQFLFRYAQKNGWTNVSDTEVFDAKILGTIADYLNSYDLTPHHVFIGMDSMAALKDVVQWVKADNTTVEDMNATQLEHLHVGKIESTPVYFNEHLKNMVVFSAVPEAVGMFSRMGNFGSVLIHNAERAAVIVRVKATE